VESSSAPLKDEQPGCCANKSCIFRDTVGTVPSPSILLLRGAINGLIIEQYEVEVNKPGQLYAWLPTNKLN
jgi:hypothetical protein